MKLIKIFLLCPILFVLLSSCSQENPDSDTQNPPEMESGPGSDEEIQDFTATEPLPDNTQANPQQLNTDCGEKTDPNYLPCRFEVSKMITDSIAPKENYERHTCRKEGHPEVVLLLTEYSYPTNDRPESSLVCTIFANDNLKGFANRTEGFCRNNNLPNGRIDSLAELLADYQSPNKGYICTQDISE